MAALFAARTQHVKSILRYLAKSRRKYAHSFVSSYFVVGRTSAADLLTGKMYS